MKRFRDSGSKDDPDSRHSEQELVLGCTPDQLPHLVCEGPLAELTSSLAVLGQGNRIPGHNLQPRLALITDDINTDFLDFAILAQVEGLEDRGRVVHQKQLFYDGAEVHQVATVNVFFLQINEIFLP